MSNKSKIKDSTLIQLYTRAQAPCRDYYGLTITDNNILFSTWKISYGPHLYPKCKVVPYEDMKYDKYLQEDIRNVFGLSAFEYVRSLYNKERRIETLPKKLFLNLMKYFKITDILMLGRCSKIFKELCDSEDVWQIIYQKYLKRKCYPEERRHALDLGWKEMTKRKVLLRKKATDSQVKTVPSKAVVKPKMGQMKSKVQPSMKRSVKIK